MKLLLDTHVFLGYISADTRLPAPFLSSIRDTSNEVFLSAASIREAVIKHGLDELPLPAEPAGFLPELRERLGIVLLPIEEGVMVHLTGLPDLHPDPIDRLLIAQAIRGGMRIVTFDAEILAHPVARLGRSAPDTPSR
ncbi:MAG: type II toxin-antitoxin system VapC family toxin [Isosphaeraceae bacterium]